jgi:hypothetical protein
MFDITMPLKNLPNDSTPIFMASPDINTPLGYMVVKLFIFKPQAVKSACSRGDHTGQETPKPLNFHFHFDASVLNWFCGVVNL